MSEDNKINQESCSNEQLFQIMDNFLKNMMMSVVEFRDCYEQLHKHIVDLCDIMDNLEAKKLDLNKGKTTDDV